jgi:hypothetical protein
VLLNEAAYCITPSVVTVQVFLLLPVTGADRNSLSDMIFTRDATYVTLSVFRANPLWMTSLSEKIRTKHQPVRSRKRTYELKEYRCLGYSQCYISILVNESFSLNIEDALRWFFLRRPLWVELNFILVTNTTSQHQLQQLLWRLFGIPLSLSLST